MNLSEKYRPVTWNEIVGQKEIRTALQRITWGSMNHLFFIGTYGIGKTTIANIIAKQVTSLYQNSKIKKFVRKDYTNIKQLINFIEHVIIHHWSREPLIFVLDEFDSVDIKYHKFFSHLIEQYFHHAKFIFITNFEDETKLDGALRGRVEMHYFEPLSSEQIVPHLEKICSYESIVVLPDKLRILAAESKGDIRWAIDQLQIFRRCK